MILLSDLCTILETVSKYVVRIVMIYFDAEQGKIFRHSIDTVLFFNGIMRIRRR